MKEIVPVNLISVPHRNQIDNIVAAVKNGCGSSVYVIHGETEVATWLQLKIEMHIAIVPVEDRGAQMIKDQQPCILFICIEAQENITGAHIGCAGYFIPGIAIR